MATNRPPYHGTKRKLVLAFDLGTTYSGISYVVLDPGKVPETKTVTRYLGQDAGDSKVQTVIYYDKSGKVLAAGAEEPSEKVSEDQSDDEWEEVEEPIKAEWFKLLVGQRRPAAEDSGVPRTNLPASKRDIVDVFADFYTYLYNRAHTFIVESHANGALLWDSIQGDIEFILTHPNDWGGAQQNLLKRAAAKAGLVPMTPAGFARIQCVTEGEASLHYCISSGLIADAITVNENVMIIDAGGGTVDFSTYKITDVAPIALQEIAPSDCIYRGSVMVGHEARKYIQKKLAHSRFGAPAYVDAITNEFDRMTKKRFRGTGDSHVVKFSNLTGDRDPEVGVRNGQLRLSAAEVASFFEPSLREITAAVDAQLSSAQETVDNIFLVGGFAASEYLFTKLQEHLDIMGHKLSRPDGHVNKAVAEGAISFHIDHFVSTRVAKFTYGAMILAPFVPTRADHQQRAFKKFTHIDGEVCLSDIFDPILRKGTQVSETTEFERKYHQLRRKSKMHTVTTTVICYKGNNLPLWMDVQPEQFSNLCTITADVSHVPKYLQKGPVGRFYSQNFSLVLSFGLTELKAHIAWEENGQKRHGPASIVYDDDTKLQDLVRLA